MNTINLRVLYPDAYKSDYYVEVPDEVAEVFEGTVKYYAQIHLQVWQNSVCTGQGNLPLIT